MVTWLHCPVKALNVACGHSFSTQWTFTMLETKIFKRNFVKLLSQKPCCVEICTVDVKWIVISKVKIKGVFNDVLFM